MFVQSALITLTVAILSVWGLLQYFFEIDVTGGLKSLFKSYHFPVIASMGNPNFLAEFLVLSLPITLSFFRYIKKYYLFLFIFILQGLTIFLTYSRLAWAAMLIFMIISLFLSLKPERKSLLFSYLLLLVISLSFFCFHYKTDSSRSLRILKSFSNINTNILTERKIIYNAGFKMFRDSSLTGTGPGIFGYNYLDYQAKVVRELGKDSERYRYVDLSHAHSDFLEIGVDSGYIAQVIYIILVLYIVFTGIKNLVRDKNSIHKYINLIPILFIPFTIWAFPYYLPFSKMFFILAAAYFSVHRPIYKLTQNSMKYIPLMFVILILSFSYFHSRYIMSVFQYKQGLSYFKENPERSYNEFYKGILCFPYNGYNYFSAGALLLNQSNLNGILYLKTSLKYLKNSRTYHYIAKGYRDFNMIRDSKIFYKKLLIMRPDIKEARMEYKKILADEKKE